MPAYCANAAGRTSARVAASFAWARQLALILWLFIPAATHAASVFGPGSGLPNMSVRGFALDPEGYVWIGTEDGLVRFDGHRFEPLDLSSPGSPLDSYVSTLLSTPAALYVATRTSLHRYDWQTRSLQVLHAADGGQLRGLLSLALAPNATGTPSVLAGTDAGRLLQFPDQPGATAVTLDTAAAPDMGWILEINVLDERAWLATTKGVFEWDRQTQRLRPLRFPLAALDDGARYARAVLEHPRGTLWIGYWNDGLVRLNLATGEQRWFHPGQPGAGALRATSIYNIAPSAARTYIATNRGLVFHEPACDCLRGLNHPDWDKLDGIGVIIDAMLLQGDAIWTGQVGNGIYRFDAEDRVFEHQVKVDGRADGLAAPSVRALRIGSEGRLWLGTFAGVQWADAAARLRGQSWSLQTLPWSLPRSESRFLWSIEEDRDHDLWLGTGTGLYRHHDGQLKGFEPPIESARCSLLTADGRRYLGSTFGLFRVEGETLQRVSLADNGAPEPAVWSLTEFDHELWVGSASGLYRLGENEERIAHHDIGLGESDLPGSLVLQQRSTPDGRVWQITSGGLVEVSGDASKRIFLSQPALLAAQVRSPVSIEVDATGKLWMGTPRGLVRYDPTRAKVDIYDRNDGLVSDQMGVNASANDGQRLYFGSVGGLISFDPAELAPRQAELSPRVTRRRIGQGPWQPNLGELRLAHDHAPLQLELSAQHYRWPERVRYAYRWVDSESAFTELGDARTALFSNLPAGIHELELRAMLDGSFKAQATATVLTVRVAPAWHQTWWGRLAIIASLMLLVYLWVAWRNRALRAQQRLLESLVVQRTQELSRASAAMEIANARLQKLASMDPLTGLANRRQLFEHARSLQDSGELMSVVMLDVDHFKQINDRYGHDAGDAVLRQFATLLTEFSAHHMANMAGKVLCTRYGGEEFTCLLSGPQAQTAERCAAALLAQIRDTAFAIDAENCIRVTASIGCAAGTAGESLESLIRRADAALYRVKAAGRDGWQAG